ncbi:MAG: chitobiase/beta-hexosaminidase C-terminal domain-containing protein [Terriglobales bacterium]
MKTIARASLVAVMLLLVSVFCNAATCTGGASLAGYYGMLVSGNGKYLSGAVYFDGNCNLSGSNISGGSGGTYTTTSVTGTYGQNSDGTFDVTMNLAGQSAAQTYVIGVSESGNKARGLESDGTVEATIDLQSQLTTLVSGYGTASLNGTYAASCLSSGAADLNYVTFDGKGDVSGVDAYDNSGTQGSNPYSGTYSVNSDGTFSGVLVGSYSAYSFNGVIDDGVSEIEYIYDDSGSGAVLSCVGKQSTTANLSGYYGFVVSGTAQTGGGGKYLSGSVYFNGGTLTATNVNGGINSTYGNTTATGTYTVNSNNTISITINLAGQTTAQTYIVAVSEAGNEAVGIETDGTAIATIDIQSQLQLPGTPYGNASLDGIYAASCGGSEVDLNYVTFDGKGDISGVDAYDDGSYGDSPYTGSYTVNSDGTFTGSFAGSYSVFTMTGVLENGTAEMEFTYDESGVGGVVSCIGESTYGPVGTNAVAVTPTFNPAPGAFTSAESVTLADTTPGAVIYYTTNGLTPTVNSAKYSTPIAVSATTTIQAIAVASNYNNSAIAAGTYFLGSSGTPTAATPTFSPAPGSYNSAQSVTLSDTTPGATIYYTTNGTMPTTGSSELTPGSSITVSATTTIEAIAVAGGYANSAAASGTYTITASSGSTTVNLASYYNMYGIATSGNPAEDGGFDGKSGDAYNSSSLGASATYQGLTFTFGPANALDGVSSETVALPAGSYTQLYLLGAGSYGAQTNQSFLVTYTDGSTSTFTQTLSDWWSSQGYTGETVVVSPANIILSNGTVDAQPVHVYGYTFNLVAGKTAASVKLPSNRQAAFLAIGLGGAPAATPTFSPAPGSYSSAQTVTLSDTTAGAKIYYTTNGTTPTTSSSVYSSPITVSATTTIEAIAVATGYSNSAVASGTYTITSSGTGTAVNLASYYNIYGIATVGADPKSGGFDNDGYAYNSSLLGTSLSYQGVNFPLAAANTTDAVIAYTVSLPAGSYSQLYLLGAGVNGNQTNQSVVVTYTDGSTTTFTQSFSDWATGPKGYTGETTILDTASRITPTGGTQSGNIYVYGYTFSLTAGKTAASVKLPFNRDVVFLGIGLGNPGGTAITPYIQVNGGSWQQTNSATVNPGSAVNLGPQPLNVGSWSWTGPNGYTSTSRQINSIPLSVGANSYVATYTNSNGAKSTETFVITVN